MSIGIYAFLRICFLGFGVSVFAQFRTRRASYPAPPCAATIYPARPVWYRVQTGAACKESGRVCRCVASGTACAASCDVQAFRVRWGLWSPPAGYTGSAGGGAGHARDKIFQRKRRFSGVALQTTNPTFTNPNPSDCASLQKFRKIQKDPFRSLNCGIIS